MSSTFFVITNLLLYVRAKDLFSDVDLYPLHACDIKCNINPPMPNEKTVFFVVANKEHYKGDQTICMFVASTANIRFSQECQG